MDYSKFKPKRTKWLEISLLLAIIIIIIGFLIISGANKEDDTTITTQEPGKEKNYGWVNYVVTGLIIILVINKYSKSGEIAKTDFEIIDLVANDFKRNDHIILRTSIDNATVQKGGVDETYVEFADIGLTVMYKEGVGCVERYPGGTIKSVKKGKREDVIEMETAREELALKKHRNRLDLFDRTEEEEKI